MAPGYHNHSISQREGACGTEHPQTSSAHEIGETAEILNVTFVAHGVQLIDPAAVTNNDPTKAAELAEFHRRVETLPPDQREVIDLFWYQGLDRAEVALTLGVSEKTISRRWRDLRMKLADWISG
jgi:RNA polymerase sigma factor (sigma-70 family)